MTCDGRSVDAIEGFEHVAGNGHQSPRIARRHGGVGEDERLRTLHSIETDMVRSLERVGGFGGKADRLNEYLLFAGDPGFVAHDLERYRSVTADQIQEAVTRMLARLPPKL